MDLWELVRNDHDDLDRALQAMVDPATRPNELASLLDVLQLALAVHAAAESRVIDILTAATRDAPTVVELVTRQRVEHAQLRAAATALGRVRPGSLAWYSQTLEIRVHALAHATRGIHDMWSLGDYVSTSLQRQLASEYATERLRILATTSPLLVADRREHGPWL